MIGAFDIGNHFGYAFRDVSGGAVVSGTWDFSPRRFDGGGMRYLKLVDRLNAVHASTPLTRVYYEEVRRHLGNDAAHVYGGYLAHLSAWCDARSIPYEGVAVGSIKKSATGRGNADKAAMIAAVRNWGYSPVDDNEADALALLHLKLGEIIVDEMTVQPKVAAQ